MTTVNPAPVTSEVDSTKLITRTNSTSTLLQNHVNSMKGYSDAAYTIALNYADTLTAQATEITTLPVLNTTIADPEIALAAYTAPVAPTEPENMTFVAPTAPTEPVLTVPSATINAGTAPAFTATLPTIATIAAPAAFDVALPTAPTIAAPTMPVAPTYELPAVPTLDGITLPAVPELLITSFVDYSIPVPEVPAGEFSFVEPEYTSTLLTTLRTKLEGFIQGDEPTGLAPAVESAMWNRARARESVAAQRKQREVARQFAQRGFMKPPGAMAVEMMEATQEAMNKTSDMNREIMVKQADLEQSNRKWAFEQVFQVESRLIEYSNLMAQRAFEAQRFVQDLAMQIYQAAISKYNGDIQLMGQKLEAWKQNLTVELQKLDVYRAQLEAAKVAGDLNMQEVEVFKAKVDASRNVVDIYRAQVEATRTEAEVNRARIDAFAAEVGAYGELVKAKNAEYQGYDTRVRAEMSKIEVFKGQADAYRSQVDGFKALVDAKVAEKQAEIQTGVQVPLDLFRARTEVFRTKSEAEAQRVGSLGNLMDQRTRIFVAKAQGEAARVQADTGAYSAQAQIKLTQANLTLEQARNNLQAMIQKSQMLTTAMTTGANASAQVAAGALSSVHMSAGLSESFAQGFQQQISHSTSNSYQTSASLSETIAPVETAPA